MYYKLGHEISETAR